MDISVFLRGISVIAEKNIRIYYNKAPVIIFGLLFPFFMFLAFFVGRNLELAAFFPGFLAMTLFFTASSVGPLITPWEKRDRTYERLLSYPVTLEGIILGDIAAGALFGLIITTLVWVVSWIVLDLSVVQLSAFAMAFLLGTLSFAALGSLLASPASDTPSNVMMLSSLIRFPLIFISGIFIPLSQMQGWGLLLASVSPLTYLVDLFNAALTGESVISPFVDCGVLIGVIGLFILLARFIQIRNLMKGL
ncbi:MAG: ABC transporter permease [Methanomicrobiales archaeon]|nr:ABC transporter permease [Methanomicrobiales archaeon]